MVIVLHWRLSCVIPLVSYCLDIYGFAHDVFKRLGANEKQLWHLQCTNCGHHLSGDKHKNQGPMLYNVTDAASNKSSSSLNNI